MTARDLKDTGVYGIVHLATDKIYIGSTGRSFKTRFSDHIRCLRKKQHHSKKLQNAWNKYGEDAFEFVILRRCPPSEVLKYEQIFIERLTPEYNHNSLACSPLGIKRDKASVKKMTAFQRGRAPKYLVNGEMLCVAELAEKYGLSANTIYARLYKGIRGEDLVHKKPRGGQPNTGKKYLVRGEMLTLRQMSEKYNVAKATIARRITVGWDLDSVVDPILDAKNVTARALRAMHEAHNLRFDVRGERLTINEMAARYGVCRNTIYYRHSKGMSGEALIAPPSKRTPL